ncbi:MAG: Hsp70 family protein [Deltaproteobacteria bacterium]|nr:Hsp70 family protein [Deltaproteobacteria bacterium]
MGRIIGIDLGTTYSVVAVPQVIEGAFFDNINGYSVIKDSMKRRTIPSVVADDGKGNILVGHRAKGRAGMRPNPIFFVKRHMGEERAFPLAGKACRPEEVSAEILKYLKDLASQQLGEEVTEAVITVPAYFTMKQKQMTEKAGELAGLRVAQIAQEPVAAALMYSLEDARDPLTIMTYDLGGGTFDIAILEKRDGVFSVKAFDGNRFLGGFDFDKRLTFWIIEQLSQYDLNLNLDDDNDSIIFSKFMILAERAKIELSKVDIYQMQEPNTGIVDHRGEPVSIELEIPRTALEDLIRDYIEDTVRYCWRAMNEKATPAIKPEQIDEIVMVGGSSRIPMVAQRLEQEFGRTPRLVEPDLCVAIGAAILAGTQGQRLGSVKLDSIPSETDLPFILVSGTVQPSKEFPQVSGCRATLRAADGSYQKTQDTPASGGFAFQQVRLAPEATSEFLLRVAASDGRELLAHRFTVKQSAGAVQAASAEGLDTNILAKPIRIMTIDGLENVVNERTALPHECHVPAETTDQSGVVRVAIYEENNLLGEIVVDGLPTTLPIASGVDITLNIQRDYQILGKAYVPAVARNGQVVVQLPPIVVKGLDELRLDFENLLMRGKEALAAADPGKVFALGKRVREGLDAVHKMLNEKGADRAKIQERMDEVATLIEQLSTGWRPDPAREVFIEAAQEVENLIAQVCKKKPEAAQDGYEQQLQAICNMAEKAYVNKNTTTWKDAARRLVDLQQRLEKMLNADLVLPPPDPQQLVLQLGMELQKLRGEASKRGRLSALEKEFQSCADSLKRIDPKDADAMTQIRDYYLTKHQPLEIKVTGETEPALGGVVRILKS